LARICRKAFLQAWQGHALSAAAGTWIAAVLGDAACRGVAAMPTLHTSHASALPAIHELLGTLIEDRLQLQRYYRDFERSMRAADLSSAELIVNGAIDLLVERCAIDHELLYPAARQALPAPPAFDELEAATEMLDSLLNAACLIGPRDDAYAERFEQLCLLAMHHALDQEHRLFPLLADAPVPWPELVDAVQWRRQRLLAGAAQREARAQTPDADECLRRWLA